MSQSYTSGECRNELFLHDDPYVFISDMKTTINGIVVDATCFGNSLFLVMALNEDAIRFVYGHASVKMRNQLTYLELPN